MEPLPDVGMGRRPMGMTETMRAMVLDHWGGSFRLEKRERPHPDPGEAVLRVRSVGVGYTLVNIWSGAFSGTVPRVLGNEIAGDIVEVGEGVRTPQPGDRCLVYFYMTCGRCRWCRSGRETLCLQNRGLVGVRVDGGFQDYVCLPAENFIEIPDTLDYEAAAITADAVCTPWHCMKERAQVKPLDDVLIIGAGGGVGIHGVQMARLFGGQVIAADIGREKLDLAKTWGATHGIDASREDVPKRVRELTDGKGVEAAVDFAGKPETARAGLLSLAASGRLVMVGVQPGTMEVEPRIFIGTETTVTGSRYATKQEMREAIAVVAGGMVRPVVTVRMPLEEVEQLFDLLRAGHVLGRAALTM
jgi:propanol-preferring alcohol dehydrogenase